MIINKFEDLPEDPSIDQIKDFMCKKRKEITATQEGEECLCGSFVPKDPSVATHKCMDCKRGLL